MEGVRGRWERESRGKLGGEGEGQASRRDERGRWMGGGRKIQWGRGWSGGEGGGEEVERMMGREEVERMMGRVDDGEAGRREAEWEVVGRESSSERRGVCCRAGSAAWRAIVVGR